MNPILHYLKEIFASKRILGANPELLHLVKADALLQQLVAQKRVPGLAITVLKDGKTVFQKGYGYADLEKKKFVDPQKTIFRIASISKPIAATALGIMVEEGIMHLDASFYDYVPYYPKKRWDFTIRQLASHTAGIRGYRGKEFGFNEPFSIKESLVLFQDDELVFEPGKGYLYNSFDWVLISLAMQEASGIPFEKYVQEKVLIPLGMQNTVVPQSQPEGNRGLGAKNIVPSKPVGSSGVENQTEQQNQVSTPFDLIDCITSFYTKNKSGFKEAIPVNNFYKLAGGGYLSTSEDVAKLGQAYLENKFLDGATKTELLTAQTILGKSTFYGLGWQVSEDVKGRTFYGHIGSSVGAYSNFFVYPNEQLVVCVLINATDPKVQEALDEVVDAFLHCSEIG